jgi:curved DNA-binding protein CbpA
MRHHPDRNRTDPDASQRFARISAAYNVLGNASKRAVYDRDNGFHQIHPSTSPGHTHTHPMGSHSSHGSYAGSRPASGLSKRRSAFHGPPPSFYEQGGYGASGRQGDGFAAGKAGSSPGAGAGFASGGSAASGRYADPEDWEGFIKRNPLHHFNAQGHFRTQAAEDKRRRQRASNAWRRKIPDAEWPEPEPGVSGTSFSRFLFSLGCLVLAGASAGFWPSSPMPVSEVKMARQRKESLS